MAMIPANEMLDHLRKGRDTYARRAWHDAYHASLCADEATPLGPTISNGWRPPRT